MDQSRTKILVFLAVWRRPEITELCFQGINRLRRHPDYDVHALAVISEEPMADLCSKYNINFVLHDNLPLGKKKNHGLQVAKRFDFDYLMEIGSDDLVLNELLEDYKPLIGEKDFFGIRDLAYLDTETGKCRRYKSKNTTYGAGRMISRKALERMNWTLWLDRINRGLDNNSVFNLARNGIFYNQVKAGEFPKVLDVKSDENIWPFNHLLGVEYDAENILSRLSEEERQTLSCIIQRRKQLAE